VLTRATVPVPGSTAIAFRLPGVVPGTAPLVS
jgi:hypothetical protein